MTKSLKITKAWAGAINRRTDNTMEKGKWTKGKARIYKILHRRLKLEQHEPN
jgi:hypothetical protein